MRIESMILRRLVWLCAGVDGECWADGREHNHKFNPGQRKKNAVIGE